MWHAAYIAQNCIVGLNNWTKNLYTCKLLSPIHELFLIREILTNEKR